MSSLFTGNQAKAHHQWAKRPQDERFLSLDEMQSHFDTIYSRSRARVVSTHGIEVKTDSDDSLRVYGPNGHGFLPTHWSFGQLANLAGAPAGYLRGLPARMSSACVQYGLRYLRRAEDIGVLLEQNGDSILRAATGPRYGRIWNREVICALRNHVGDGLSGDWRVPGEFSKAITVTKDNTTLYASDRDMFVFLADEKNRIELPKRRDGKTGSLAKGIYIWNSEVGAATFGLGLFLFDFVCCNRLVVGMEDYKEIKIRHTVSAPDRYFEEIAPAIERYAQSDCTGIVNALEAAQKAKIQKLDEFLTENFGPRLVKPIKDTFMLEEGRPMESVFDAVTGATAYARSIPYQNERVEFEKAASALLTLN